MFRRRRVFPGFQYGDDLRLPPYCWDLVPSEAVVKHCKQPLVSFGHKLFNCSTSTSSIPAVVLFFKLAMPLLYSSSLTG